MKTKIITLAVLMMTAVGFAQIAGTAHDFSDGAGLDSDAWMTAGSNEKCEACHTAHNAVSTNGPLWNRADNAASVYTAYTSPFNTLDGVAGQPGAASKLCLSCHDGVLALDAYGGAGGTAGDEMGSIAAGAGAAFDFGTTLANDHPVGITYNTASAGLDGGLVDPSGVGSGPTTTIDADMLFGGVIECASCHDVHGGVVGTQLLIVSNTNSALCTTCHVK